MVRFYEIRRKTFEKKVQPNTKKERFSIFIR
jgi:hypothetical protein